MCRMQPLEGHALTAYEQLWCRCVDSLINSLLEGADGVLHAFLTHEPAFLAAACTSTMDQPEGGPAEAHPGKRGLEPILGGHSEEV